MGIGRARQGPCACRRPWLDPPRRDQEPPIKRLFSYDDINGEPTESQHKALTPYLFDAGNLADRNLVVREISRPLCAVPSLVSGTQPIDDGNYIFDRAERDEFLRREPKAEKFLRPFIGAEEYINGHGRWILSLQSASPNDLREMPLVAERMRNVREFRRKSKRESTLAIADFPERYNVELIPSKPFLAVPEVSSERREYIPIGWLSRQLFLATSSVRSSMPISGTSESSQAECICRGFATLPAA